MYLIIYHINIFAGDFYWSLIVIKMKTNEWARKKGSLNIRHRLGGWLQRHRDPSMSTALSGILVTFRKETPYCSNKRVGSFSLEFLLSHSRHRSRLNPPNFDKLMSGHINSFLINGLNSSEEACYKRRLIQLLLSHQTRVGSLNWHQKLPLLEPDYSLIRGSLLQSGLFREGWKSIAVQERLRQVDNVSTSCFH